MSDKRSVSTDALTTLGTIIEEGGRDAIHLAVEPVMAGEQLYPGQHIGVMAGVATTKAPKKLGIVDPFISGFVPQGSKFWLIVYPRQITSLRHVWEHPDFPPEGQAHELMAKANSEQWLRNFCSISNCPGYEEVIAAAVSGDHDEYLHFNGQNAHGDIPTEFWDHVEIVTGRKMQVRPEHFSCSC